MTEIDNMPSKPTEKELADAYANRLRAALAPVTALMDEAKRDGLLLEFQVGQNMYGQAAIVSVGVVRRLL